jgi:predicted transcriptional regulator
MNQLMSEKPKYMPVKDYALKKGITVQAVYKMIKENRVETKTIGTYTLVKE